jgi:hypothetical protein
MVREKGLGLRGHPAKEYRDSSASLGMTGRGGLCEREKVNSRSFDSALRASLRMTQFEMVPFGEIWVTT